MRAWRGTSRWALAAVLLAGTAGLSCSDEERDFSSSGGTGAAAGSGGSGGKSGSTAAGGAAGGDAACEGEGTSCQGQAVVECLSGTRSEIEVCPYLCVGQGECVGECVPGTRGCLDQVPRECNETGKWEEEQACEFACTGSGVCGGVCVPGETRCADNGVETCSEEGEWGHAVACDAQTPVCDGDGVCGTPPSCSGLAGNCGPEGDQNCCSSIVVPGGSFNRSNDASYPATLSTFRLDTYEVTVGRFRKFVNAYSQDMIPEGAGKHPRIAGDPGWMTEWNANLPADQAALKSAMKCNTSYQTWSDSVSLNENKPMTCLYWWVANAFCIWDGGRLPTEAEWNYAAAGGSEQREYPWGDTAPQSDEALAVHDCSYNGLGTATGTCAGYQNIGTVGAIPAGNGRWGHADLAGNLYEWTLDVEPLPEDGYNQEQCNDCTNIGVAGENRMYRSGSFMSPASEMRTTYRNGFHPDPSVGSYTKGVRCARAE